MKIISKRPNGSVRVVTRNEEPSKTDQSFLKETDINHIVSKFLKTGQMDTPRVGQGVYADITQFHDLPTAMNQVTKAQEAFDALPAKVRERFGNSPLQMVQFLQDPKNDDEAIKLGLKSRRVSTLTPETKAQAAVATPPKKQKKSNTTNDDKPNDDE